MQVEDALENEIDSILLYGNSFAKLNARGETHAAGNQLRFTARRLA